MTLYGVFDAEPDPLDEPKPDTSEASEPAETAERADLAADRYNIAPTSTVPVVLNRRVPPEDGNPGDGEVHRYLRGMRWGLVPSWAKDVKIGAKLFNARADSVAAKPAFRSALAKRRCLLPASGYYEWRKVGTVGSRPDKQPFYITPADGSVLAFAGLWEFWRSPEGEPLVSATIITTDAVGELAEIHDRMPLVLPAADWDAWLDLDNAAADVAPLLVPPDPDLVAQLELRPVSTRVGSVVNDDPGLLDPVAVRAGLF